MTPEEIHDMGNNFERGAREGEPGPMDIAAALCYCAAEICQRLDSIEMSLRSAAIRSGEEPK